MDFYGPGILLFIKTTIIFAVQKKKRLWLVALKYLVEGVNVPGY